MGQILTNNVCFCRPKANHSAIRSLWVAMTPDGGDVTEKVFTEALGSNAGLVALLTDSGMDLQYFVFSQPHSKLSFDEFRTHVLIIGTLKDTFDEIDEDKKGFISRQQLSDALRKNPSLLQLCAAAGLDTRYFLMDQASGCYDKLSWESFREKLKCVGNLYSLFSHIDKNNNGVISKKDFMEALDDNHKLVKKCKERGMDPKAQLTGGDGSLTWPEFRDALKSTM